MPADNKMTMTRVIVGVASVGATLALVYLYNKFQDRKGNKGSSSGGAGTASSSGSRIRRQSSKEAKKVTFKTNDEDEGRDEKGRKSVGGSVPASIDGVDDKRKLKTEFDKESLAQPSSSPLSQVVKHVTTSASTKSDLEQSCSSLNSSEVQATNSYENSSTLQLEDISNKPEAQASPRVTSEEVVKGLHRGQPLMTSTPLPGKEGPGGGQVPKRTAAAVFPPTETHSSDLPSSAPAASTQQPGQGGSSRPVQAAEADYESYAYRKEMRIPRELVPGLIGKKGCNIKGIQAQSDTNINFHDETLENGDRICLIRGSPANVTMAESLIEKFMIEQPIVYTETLTVPLSSVGRIIGRGGETIRSIQDLSKARVTVESQNHYGSGDTGGHTRTITVKGSEDQIRIARQLIVEKVDEDRNLRKNIDVTTASRTHRRPGGGVSPSNVSGANGSVAAANSEPSLPVKQDGILEVFVSCVYHPNDFWIQVVGRDSIELDKLCESMTDYYNAQQNSKSASQFQVGDIVAAPFEVDGKIYRAKIVRIEESKAEVSYLDYGDRRVLPVSEIYELHPNFLQLRYQAIQATLNLGCIGEKWEDDAINEFCDRSYCAQWQSLTAKVKDYLKDVEDGHDVIWIELLDKEVNIGEELVRKRLATPKGPSGCNGAQRKSYAAAALGLASKTPSTQPVITSTDPTVQESMDSDKNGN